MADAPSPANEDELLAQIRGGDAEAFVEYAELKRRPLEAFVRRKLSDALRRKVEPEDIVQEAIIGAAGGFDQMDLSERDPFSWLCHLAERRIIDAHRRFFGAKKRAADKEVGLDARLGDGERGGFIDLLVASMTSPSQAFSREQREFRMLAALGELPDDARTALRLRYVDGLPSKEIAERLGKTDAAVRVLLTRSLGKLQKKLRTDTLFKSFVRNDKDEGRSSEPLR